MKIYLLPAFLFFILFDSGAQKEIKTTSSFTISGKVKSAVTVNLSDLKKFKTVNIGDVTILNYKNEVHGVARAVKGILLKDVLSLIEIESENSKVLNEYYFICKANDNYKAVYSWNELFNTSVGDSTYIVVEKEGQSVEKLKESILLLSPKDFKTGRRHIKSLASIEVKRAE